MKTKHALLYIVCGATALSAARETQSSTSEPAPTVSPEFARKLRDPSSYRVDVRGAARESPGDGNTKSLCGLDDLEHVRRLREHRKFAAAVRAVQGRVAALAIRRFGDFKFCTATLLDDSHLLTASHCLERRTEGKVAVFGFELNPDGSKGKTIAQRLRKIEVDGVDHDLDYAIVTIDPVWEGPIPRLSVGAATPDKTAGILQHPFGRAKQVDFGRIVGTDAELSYEIDTAKSSSGSPIFDTEGRLLGVHTTAGCGFVSGANKGIGIDTIRADLASRPSTPKLRKILELLK